MSTEDPAPETVQDLIRPLRDAPFQFACHPGVPCFTECCRDLRLQLTPYDVLRLRSGLGISSARFLHDYAEAEFDELRQLPMAYLKMRNDLRKTCPFVGPAGCAVYADRPAACRTYPLALASRVHRVHGTVLEYYFVLREGHCKGFAEKTLQTADEWIRNQGLEPYHEQRKLWMQLITHPRIHRGAVATVEQQQMFYQSCYNLDRFRALVIGGRLVQSFDLSEQELHAARTDHLELLRLAFKWLRFALLSEPTLELRA
jgi:hypothetical protein